MPAKTIFSVADVIKVFRDPIYSLISFSKKEDKAILDIINTPEFQRLRRIRQLGFSSYTFPTATHDRFSHSLGVAFLIGEMFDNLNIPSMIKVNTPGGEEVQLSKSQLKLLLKLAGLLHDIGHGPFSHAFEKVTKVDHEEMSIKIINNKKGNIYPVLTSMDDEILKKYAVDWIKEILTGTFRPIWAKELISSQLDADRMDYLLRDAYMCGVNYASFDLKWLFQNIEIGNIPTEDNRLGLLINAKKGIHAVEAFIISRYHMYEQVYFHKTTRGFEVLAQKIFERLKELVSAGADISFINPYLKDFILDNSNLDAYLSLDDFNLFTHFKHWADDNKDEILKMLCYNVINRKPYKMFREVENKELFNRKEYKKIAKLFNDENKENYYYFEDQYLNVAYKDYYLLGKKTAHKAEHIWLKYPDGDLKEFAEVSPIIKSLRNNELRKKRAYIYRNYLEKIKKALL